ncbi:hypothetical protein QFX18_16795 [Saccharophagus degradans]|uniref:hypothetical protein n=1 Tax=Saccharophagus degradans TaxID=86304 RepID=UPI002477FFF9|nr:hypothetical protein [Saccharophagus degradans]WGO97672.1 hypothetical protein QFX18_16795 [Saccharophagus degradans]
MNKKHLLGYLVAGAALAACGGESTSSAPDLNINVTVGGSGSSSGSSSSSGGSSVEIENTPLPIEESFAASDTQNFFSDNYKALASVSASADVDNFYFSAAGLFQPDGTTLADPQKTWITADADPALRFGDSRWTIGQTVSDLAIFDPNDGNARNKSTPGSSPTESWGELDLSSPYTISFCVVDITDGGNLQVYVDNNTSSKGSSIFPNDSLIYTSGASAVPKGQRVVINSDIGTANSFIQFRMDSGGAVVIDDLIIENAGAPATTPPDCSTKTTEYLASQTLGGGEEPEAVAGTAFTGIPLTGSFSLSFDNLFGTDDTATFTSMSDDTAVPFNTVTGGGSRITVADGKLSMNDARFTMGDKGDAATADAVAPVGDIDLSKPYTIEIVISDFTMEAAEAGSFIVYVDNNTSSSGNSLHGEASKLATLKTDDAEVATLPYTLTIDSDVGTANSFIQLRADSKVGNITIDSVSIKYQPVDNSDTVVTWNSYSGDKKPVEADSLTLADGSLSTMVDGGTDLTDAYWSVASGIASFNTTAGGVKPYATFGPIMPEPVAYPQTYTMIARLANPNTIDKSFEIESSFGGTDGDATSPKAGRIKLMLRDDRVQIENFDGDADPEWRWDASSFDVTEFHTYQLTVTLTSARSATATVYVDGVERIAAVQTDTLRDTSVDTNRISIGENGSSDYEADVDWIIWTNDGAFTAEELIGKLPSTIGDVSTYTAD